MTFEAVDRFKRKFYWIFPTTGDEFFCCPCKNSGPVCMLDCFLPAAASSSLLPLLLLQSITQLISVNYDELFKNDPLGEKNKNEKLLWIKVQSTSQGRRNVPRAKKCITIDHNEYKEAPWGGGDIGLDVFFQGQSSFSTEQLPPDKITATFWPDSARKASDRATATPGAEFTSTTSFKFSQVHFMAYPWENETKNEISTRNA